MNMKLKLQIFIAAGYFAVVAILVAGFRADSTDRAVYLSLGFSALACLVVLTFTTWRGLKKGRGKYL
ncbi:hypothetical protein [Streptomyces zingiberis]|uniref:Uncharacterized protein n=1 Tax=Streptomyces zingiberis TaxID=2053010 RepID=A0ABX1C1N9_9ACTN|nr:hypothetical protein [Streptomyces zingiberis]NJQ02518.1 hypothetical protein [Streptomyces zingiberis]